MHEVDGCERFLARVVVVVVVVHLPLLLLVLLLEPRGDPLLGTVERVDDAALFAVSGTAAVCVAAGLADAAARLPRERLGQLEGPVGRLVRLQGCPRGVVDLTR